MLLVGRDWTPIDILPLTLAGLSIASLPKYAALWPRARRAGAEREWLLTVCLSMFNNLATACAAFLLGIAGSGADKAGQDCRKLSSVKIGQQSRHKFGKDERAIKVDQQAVHHDRPEFPADG